MRAYQPEVIEEAEYIIQGLKECNFFSDFEIEDLTFTKEYLLDKLTEKYIAGILTDEEVELFSEEEFNQILREIVAGSILHELKEKGLVESYEDDNTEEVFFLTEEGKKHLNETEESDEESV